MSCRKKATRNLFLLEKKPTCSSHQTPAPDPLRNFLIMSQSFYTPANRENKRSHSAPRKDLLNMDPSVLHLTDSENPPTAQQKPNSPNNVILQCQSKANHGTKRSGEGWEKNLEGKVKNLDDEPPDILDECPCLIHGAERAASPRTRETGRPLLREWVGWPDETELLVIKPVPWEPSQMGWINTRNGNNK